MTSCAHDIVPGETLRQHMIRAHGCSEAHVRWWLYMSGFGIAMAVVARPPVGAPDWASMWEHREEVADAFVTSFRERVEWEGWRLGLFIALEALRQCKGARS